MKSNSHQQAHTILKIWLRWQQRHSLLPFLWAFIFLSLALASILTNTWLLAVPLAFIALFFNALGLITTRALAFSRIANRRRL